MSHKQNFAAELMEEWQKHMQEYLNDPRVAELMVDYYAKFQNNIEQISKTFTHKSQNDGRNESDITTDAMERIALLEARVEFLERLLAGAFKDRCGQ